MTTLRRTFPRDAQELRDELQRINRILIPKSRRERERFDRSRFARVIRRVAHFVEQFTEDGQLLLLFVPLAGLVALDVRHSHAYLAWAIVSSILIASAVVARRLVVRDVDGEIVVPRRVTAGEECTFTVVLSNRSPVRLESLRLTGPFLGWDGRWTHRREALAELESRAKEAVELRARFYDRGEHRLDAFRLQRLAPFGLCLGPVAPIAGPRFKVVPRIAKVQLSALEKGRKHHPGGVPKASRMADSRELLGVRPYRPGDPLRDLHARTWARIGVPAVREFQEEYFSRIAVVLDCELGRVPPVRFEAAVSLVAGIVAEISRTEAIVDVLVLAGKSHATSVGRSLGTLDRALDLLADVDSGVAFDEQAVFAELLPRLPRLSTVILVTLHDDEARRSFLSRVLHRGTTCRGIFVTTDERLEIGVQPGLVPLDANRILRGEPVAC